MARKYPLCIEARKFDMLPFTLVVLYKKKGVYSEMLVEGMKTYPELLNLTLSGEDVNNSEAFVFRCGGPNIFLFITDTIALDVLVHECTHVVFGIFERIGSEINDDTEEFFAYLTEFIFRETLKITKDIFKLKLVVSE